MEFETNPVVVRSVFPAEVVTPVGEVRRQCLVKVTRWGVYVWHGERELILAAAHKLTEDERAGLPQGRVNGPPLRIPLADDGGVVTVNRAPGCGCASSLKSFRPFGAEQVASR